MRKMSVSEFRKQLRDEIDEICKENGWDAKKPTRQGSAFEIWCARTISEDDARFGGDAIDAVVGGSGDLGADLVFHDSRTGETLICQCKWVSGRKRVARETVDSFLGLHDQLGNRSYVHDHGSRGLRDALPDSRLFESSPGKFTYRLISNAQLDEAAWSRLPQESADADKPTFEIWDRDELKKRYLEASSLVDDVPEHVTLDLRRDEYLEIDGPMPGIVAILTTNALRNLWDEFKNGLYAQNIRGGLNTKLNKEMQATLAARPENFFYFNNGISAICTDYRLDDNRLEADQLQIINGAQTLNAIGANEMLHDGRVLFRLTKTDDVSTESGINAEIIRYNNTQNAVLDSDFRSNDPIQRWLESQFKKDPWPWPSLARRHYVRKRQGPGRRSGLGRQLKLEEFGKIRYAWLHEPTVVLDSKKLLFQDPETGGHYAKAFGVAGEMRDQWPQAALDDAVLAVWCAEMIEEKLKAAKRDDEEKYSWLPVHRWHFLSLAGEFFRQSGHVAHGLLHDRTKCEDVFDQFFAQAFKVIIEAERRREQDVREGRHDVTVRTWRRSTGEWEKVRSAFLGTLRDDAMLQKLVGGRT